MSRSPLGTVPGVRPAEEASEDPAEAYAVGWAAINKLIRSGYSWSGHEQNCAFLNLGSGARFADVSAVSGLGFEDDARATALVDWDQDGDTDVFMTNRTGPRVRFLRNDQAAGNKSVTLVLIGTRSNRDAIGARAALTVRDPDGERRTLVRGVRAGEGYLAQSSTRLTIGLGAGTIEGLAVTWPGGRTEEFGGLEPGGFFRLVEGSARAERWTPRMQPAPLASGTVEPPLAGKAARIVLARPLPLPRLALVSAEGEPLSLFGIQAGGSGTGTGKPVLLELFSRHCAACVSEARMLAARADELEESGIAFLTVGVDGPGERARTSELLQELGWPFPWAFAEPDALEALDGLQGCLLDREKRLPLPARFLIDAEGALRVLTIGAQPLEQLLADRELLALDEDESLTAATPFGGRWMFPVLEPDADFLEGRLRARGLEELAREYARGRMQVVRSSPAELLHQFGRRAAGEGRFDEALDFFRRALAADPEHFDSLSDLGLVLHRQERLDEALAAYGKALALRPDHADTRFNLALAWLGKGEREPAERQLRWLREHDAASAAVLEEAFRRSGD